MSSPPATNADGLPDLPAAVEDRLYEILLDREPADRPALITELIASNPACEPAIRARVTAMTAADDVLARAQQPLAEQPLPDAIANYRICDLLGEGGFGTVYRAEQLEPVHRTVALKVLLARRFDERSQWRFQAERQALARMQHPNIAQIYDAGSTDDGLHYFAMEFVDGEPVTRWCDQQQLAIDARLELFQRVCAGVQHAHQRGVVHRDLKPSNVLVATVEGDGVPKVIDFGIAKMLEVEDGSSLATRDGALIGTPGYMSPEQAAGRPIDTRTDVYALGVLLYELLTGDLPFARSRLVGDVAAIAEIVRAEEPRRLSTAARAAGDDLARLAESRGRSATALLRELHGDLEWIVRRALAKNPDHRYSTVAELTADIARFRRREPVTAREPEALYLLRRFVARHRLGVAVSLGVVLLAVGLIAFLVWSLDEVQRARQTAEERTRVAVRNEYAAHLAAARAALGSGDAESARLHLETAAVTHRGWEWRYLSSLCDMSLDSFSVVDPITEVMWLGPDELGVVFGDGRVVARNADHDWLQRDLGRLGFDSQRHLFDAASNRIFAIANQYRAVVALDLATGDRQELFAADPALPRLQSDIRALALSHDGRTLAISQNSKAVTLLDVTGQLPPRALCTGRDHAWSMAFCSGDDELVIGNGKGWVEIRRVHDGALLGDYYLDDQGAKAVVVGPEGRTVYAAAGNRLHRIDLVTKTVMQRVDAGCEITELALSDDSATLYGIGRPGAGRVQAWSASTLELVGRYHGHREPVTSLDIEPGTGRLATASTHIVRFFRPQPTQPFKALPAGFNANDFAVSPDGSAFGTSTSTGIVRVWDARSCRLEFEMRCDAEVYGMALGRDTIYLGGDRMLAIARESRATRVGQMPHHGVSCMTLDPEERWLLAGSIPWGRVAIWRLPELELLHELELPVGDSAIFDAATESFVMPTFDDRLLWIDPRTGAVTDRPQNDVGSNIITRQGRQMAVGRERLFVGHIGTELRPAAPATGLTGAAISPDLRRIVACTGDAAVTFWDREGTELLVLDSAPKPVFELQFVAGGRRLAGLSKLPGAQCFVMVWGPHLE